MTKTTTTTKTFKSTLHDRTARDRLEDRIGALVRELRMAAEVPLRRAAKAAELSVQHVSDCERGGRRFSEATLRVVAELLGVDLDQLVASAGGCRHCGGSGVDPGAAFGPVTDETVARVRAETRADRARGTRATARTTAQVSR